MNQKYRLAGVMLMAAVFLAGCGGDNGDYSQYVKLGDYKSLSADLVTAAVTEQDINDYQQELLDEYVTYETVSGPVKEGQLVTVSLLAEDGDEVVYDFTDEDGYELIIGEAEFGSEVDDRLIGSGIGDILDFSVSYDEDFTDALLCGREISFHMEVVAVSDVTWPELTNAFVKETFGETSVEAWRETLKEELRAMNQADAEDDLRTDLVQQAVDGAVINGYPKSLYKQSVEEINAEYQSYADMFGCTIDEIYDMFEVDEEQLREEYLNATYQTMVLAMIREKENLTLSEEQLQEKTEAYAKENDFESAEELLEVYDAQSIERYFLNEMTIDFLEEHADIRVMEE